MRRRTLLAAGAAAVSGLAGCGSATGDTDDPTDTATAPELAPSEAIEMNGRPVAEAVANEDGQTAYVAFCTGFASVDISTPSAPSVLATRTDTGIDRGLDVKQNGDHMIFVGPAHRATRANSRCSRPIIRSTTRL
jgi:hypothetical protein